jgi:hypothetical protein
MYKPKRTFALRIRIPVLPKACQWVSQRHNPGPAVFLLLLGTELYRTPHQLTPVFKAAQDRYLDI